MDLNEIRKRIDQVDSEIIALLSQRARLVSAAGHLKKDEQGVRDPKRVAQVIEKVRTKAGEAGLDPDIAEKTYRTIINCFITQELREFKGDAGKTVAVYQGPDLPLRQNVPGAKMWAVALEKSMLTYFEMEPDTVFPEHAHEAEQITLVLEGTLTFTYDGKRTLVKAGEVIAIPSNLEHAVATGKATCRAVDAWSPVRKEYIS